MNTTISWLIAVILSSLMVALGFYCRRGVKKRWERLASLRLICESDSLDQHNIRRVVAIDFGYGKEIWLLRSVELDVDRKKRTFRNSLVLEKNATLPKHLANMQEEIGVRF